MPTLYSMAYPEGLGSDPKSKKVRLAQMKETINNKIEAVWALDWDFKGVDTSYLTHKYHSYPARFIPQIPKVIINNFSNRGEIILDPFVGCGTLLVEARLSGRSGIGVDINPLAVLISKVKSTPLDPAQLKKQVDDLIKKSWVAIMESRGEFKKQSRPLSEPILDLKIPEMPKRKLASKFTPQIKKELAVMKSKILEEIEDPDIKDFCVVGLSSTIRTVVESKSKNMDVFKTFVNDLEAMVNRMREFYNVCPKDDISISVHCKDFREANFIDDGCVSAIATSPTYVNAYDYHREHMFNLFWMGDYLNKRFHMDFDTFRKNELGAHSHFILNRFRAVTEYFDGLYKCFQHMNRVLKLNGICCVVIGDSTVEGECIKSHEYFKKIGKKIGLATKADILRNIDVKRKYLSKSIGKINQEHVLIFKKVREGWEKGDPIAFTKKMLNELLRSAKTKNREKIRDALSYLS